jgi:hypothetical protein
MSHPPNGLLQPFVSIHETTTMQNPRLQEIEKGLGISARGYVAWRVKQKEPKENGAVQDRLDA